MRDARSLHKFRGDMEELLSRLAAFLSRFFGLIILPSQLPGEVVELWESFCADPVANVRTWSPATVRRLAWQLATSQKMTLPDNRQLERLRGYRTRYAARGWKECPLRLSLIHI